MPLSTTTPSLHSGYVAREVLSKDLRTEYAHLREDLERLLTDPVKDFQKIDAAVDQLELLQLAFKEEHGIKGNNPNE